MALLVGPMHLLQTGTRHKAFGTVPPGQTRPAPRKESSFKTKQLFIKSRRQCELSRGRYYVLFVLPFTNAVFNALHQCAGAIGNKQPCDDHDSPCILVPAVSYLVDFPLHSHGH